MAGETPVSEAICLPVQRWRRSRSISTTTAWGVGRCSRCGRDERSCNPASPSRRCRTTHLRTVRGQMPTASATASGVCPLATGPVQCALNRAASAGHSPQRGKAERCPNMCRCAPSGGAVSSASTAHAVGRRKGPWIHRGHPAFLRADARPRHPARAPNLSLRRAFAHDDAPSSPYAPPSSRQT